MIEALDALPGLVGEGLFGLVLASLATGALRAGSRIYARRSMLGFGGSGVDIVLPASETRSPATGGVTRPTTGKGSVQALGEVARAIGKYYSRLRFTVHVADLEGNLDADLICIGGPRANPVTKRLLATKAITTIPGFQFDDVNFSLSVGDRSHTNFCLDIDSQGTPSRDVALIIGMANPYSPGNRALICCGFTSYGTQGAAQWFFREVLLEATKRPWGNPHGVPRGSQAWIAVLEFQITGGRPMCIDSEVQVLPITDSTS